jgi:hypothetical protein
MWEVRGRARGCRQLVVRGCERLLVARCCTVRLGGTHIDLLGVQMAGGMTVVGGILELSQSPRLDRWHIAVLVLVRQLGARQARVVVLQRAHHARVVPVPQRGFEDDALIVAFALTFRLDAVCTSWSFLAALYPSLATGKASSLGSLPHLCGASAGWRHVAGIASQIGLHLFTTSVCRD